MKKGKRRIAAPTGCLLALVLTWCIGIPPNSVRSAVPPDDFDYVVEGGEATITGYNGTAEHVVVPDQLGGAPVKNIGSSAFSGNLVLRTIGLPETTWTIGNGAFATCTNLLEVTSASGLRTIGQNAFSSCSNFRSLPMPATLERIGEYAFYNCKNFSNFSIPAGVSYIGDHAFDGTDWLTLSTKEILLVGDGQLLKYNGNAAYLELPAGTRRIYNNAFAMKKTLTEVVLPDTCHWIGQFAFYGCDNLARILVPDSVTGIDNQAFYISSPQTVPNLAIRGFPGSYAEQYVQSRWPEGQGFIPVGRIRFLTFGGSLVPDVVVDLGVPFPAPTPPTRAGHAFSGWYRDMALQIPWDFGRDTPADSLWLHAGWTLPQVTGVAAQVGANRVATLTWNAMAGATGYEIHAAPAASGPYTLVNIAEGSSYELLMAAGEVRHIRVRAYSAGAPPYELVQSYGEFSSSVRLEAGGVAPTGDPTALTPSPSLSPGTTATPGPTGSGSPTDGPSASPGATGAASPTMDPTASPSLSPEPPSGTVSASPTPTLAVGPTDPSGPSSGRDFLWILLVLAGLGILGSGGWLLYRLGRRAQARDERKSRDTEKAQTDGDDGTGDIPGESSGSG